MLAIDSSSLVRAVWLGQLTGAQERTVLGLVRSEIPYKSGLFSGDLAKEPDGLSLGTAQELQRAHKAEIVDMRERSDQGSPLAGAISIPLEEIPFRAESETNRGILQLLDCTGITPSVCSNGVLALKRAGLGVGTIGKGAYNASWCRASKISHSGN